MSHIIEKWKEFCEWQQRPYQVAVKSAEHHCCHTCGDEYQGNYSFTLNARFHYEKLTSALRKIFSIVMPQILLPDVIFEQRYKGPNFW